METKVTWQEIIDNSELAGEVFLQLITQLGIELNSNVNRASFALVREAAQELTHSNNRKRDAFLELLLIASDVSNSLPVRQAA